jgi:hypothetical protein
MQLTYFLAKFFGLYLILAALPLLFSYNDFKERYDEFLNNRGLVMLTAIMVMMLGIFLVLIHNVWVGAWPVIITLICWLTLLEGLAMLYFPKLSVGYFKSLTSRPWCMAWAVISIVLGAFLLYQGFTV